MIHQNAHPHIVLKVRWKYLFDLVSEFVNFETDIYTSRRSNNKLLFISDTEILTLLKTSANPKSGKKKKKAAEKAVASETAKAASDDAPPKLTPAAAANES